MDTGDIGISNYWNTDDLNAVHTEALTNSVHQNLSHTDCTDINAQHNTCIPSLSKYLLFLS